MNYMYTRAMFTLDSLNSLQTQQDTDMKLSQIDLSTLFVLVKEDFRFEAHGCKMQVTKLLIVHHT